MGRGERWRVLHNSDELADRAWDLGAPDARVVVFCNSRDDALKVAAALRKKAGKAAVPIELLTGARRVAEREALDATRWWRRPSRRTVSCARAAC